MEYLVKNRRTFFKMLIITSWIDKNCCNYQIVTSDMSSHRIVHFTLQPSEPLTIKPLQINTQWFGFGITLKTVSMRTYCTVQTIFNDWLCLYTNLEKRFLRYIVSATLQHYPCADCSSAFTFHINPSKPHIFWKLNTCSSRYGSYLSKSQNCKRQRNWEVFCKSIILYKFNFSPTRNEWKRKRSIAFASWYILLKLCFRFLAHAFVLF